MSQLMVYSDFDRLAELDEKIGGVQVLLAYWQIVSDFYQIEEELGQIAVLKTDVASLKMEFEDLEKYINSHH